MGPNLKDIYPAIYPASPMAPEFEGFSKIPRLSRDIIVTEKIDGTNGQILINEGGLPFRLGSGREVPFLCGSRTRWVFPENDNMGFARWAYDHADELLKLGPGRHFGEWWGQKIQRGYGLKEKRFSLFNVIRWHEHMFREYKLDPWLARNDKNRGPEPVFSPPPSCCHVVPVLYRGPFITDFVEALVYMLRDEGSKAAKGYMNPEGIVVYHTAGGYMFKKTIKDDEKGKAA